jgi:hypothetical protein
MVSHPAAPSAIGGCVPWPSIKRGLPPPTFVEVGSFGEIGLEISRDASRYRLPSAARRQPSALLAGHNPRWHVIGHLERQDDFATVVPYPHEGRNRAGAVLIQEQTVFAARALQKTDAQPGRLCGDRRTWRGPGRGWP